MALEMVAAHRDIVAHEFIAELERLQPVAADAAVAQAYDDAAQDGLELVLQLIELIQRMGVLDLLADGSSSSVASSPARSGATRVILV